MEEQNLYKLFLAIGLASSFHEYEKSRVINVN